MQELDRGEIIRAFKNRTGSQHEMTKVLAELYAVKPEVIWTVLQEEGLADNMSFLDAQRKRMPRGMDWSEEEKTRLIELLEAGVSPAEMAKELGRTECAINLKIRRLRTNKKRMAAEQCTGPDKAECLLADETQKKNTGLPEKDDLRKSSAEVLAPEWDMLLALGSLLPASRMVFGSDCPCRCNARNGVEGYAEIHAERAGRTYRLRLEEVGDGG